MARLTLTVRTSRRRHADGEYHASVMHDGVVVDMATDVERADARRAAIGYALRTLGVQIVVGDRDAPTEIVIVDAPEEA